MTGLSESWWAVSTNPIDISTEEAIKHLVRDEATAGLVAGMLTIIRKDAMVIGGLIGVLITVSFSAMWQFSALEERVTERLDVIDIRLDQVEK